MTKFLLAKNKGSHLQVPANFKMMALVSLTLFVGCIIASLCFGVYHVNFQELIDGLLKPQENDYGANIVRKRISRTVFSLLSGTALGVSGALMQAVTRNPLADPSILGVNTGAALFVVSGMVFFNISTANHYIFLALIGAGITALFVFGIGSMGRGRSTPVKLVLAGAATTAALSSIVTAITISSAYAMDQFRFWQIGSVGSANWSAIITFIPFLLIGLLIAFITAPSLNALALGDEAAIGLGVRPKALRLGAATGGVILCGAATALAGPIGFIGLLATHLTRMILGNDLRFLLPMSAVTGAIILTFSDVVGRLIARPGELEVGVVTAFIGAPILILLAIKTKVRSI